MYKIRNKAEKRGHQGKHSQKFRHTFKFSFLAIKKFIKKMHIKSKKKSCCQLDYTREFQ